MLIDKYNNKVTTDSPQTIEDINIFSQSYLAYKNQFDIIFDAVKRDPECMLVATHAALYCLLQHTQEGLLKCENFFNMARVHFNRATQREQWYFLAVEAVKQGNVKKSIQYHLQLAEHFPQDIFSAKVGHSHCLSIADKQTMLTIPHSCIFNATMG